MDAFEELVATLLEREGYWVRRDVRVALLPDDKVAIGRPTNARWEIAIVAYSGKRDELLAVQCKSFLDSRGIRAKAFESGISTDRNYYKLFTEETLRRVVLRRLATQLIHDSFCAEGVTARLALAAGHIPAAELDMIRHTFATHEWALFDPEWLRDRLLRLSTEGYEDSAVAVTAKLLMR